MVSVESRGDVVKIAGASLRDGESTESGSQCSSGPMRTESCSMILRGEVEPCDHAFLRSVVDVVLAYTEEGAPFHLMVFGHGVSPSGGLSELDRSLEDSRKPTSPSFLQEPPPACGKGGGALPAVDMQRLMDISKRLVGQFEENAVLLSVRLLVTPPKCAAQDWHLDYRAHAGLDARTVFAALTPCTADNCTEVLMPTSAEVFRRFEFEVARLVGSDGEVDASMERSQSDAGPRLVHLTNRLVDLQPLLIDQFGVACVATSRLPHRRGPTPNAEHTRVVLNCDFTTCSLAEVQRIGFVDDDFISAWCGESQANEGDSNSCKGRDRTASWDSCRGIVGCCVIDDLHSEVVVQLVD